jgi:Fur family transcriptional regulator, peroxide stress response regulator
VSIEQQEMRVNDLVAKLRGRGFRLTPQRLAVLRALVSDPSHPSVDSIYRELAPIYPMMSLATVYKTIEVLKEMGEVLELGFANGPSRYDANIPAPHAHMVCTECGRIEDVDVADVAPIAAGVAERTGYQRVRPRLDFYGRCPTCSTSRPPGETRS